MGQVVSYTTTNEVKTSLLKDIFGITKIGIVNSNLLMTFTGFWLAMHVNNISVWNELDTLIFVIVGTAFTVGGSCAINNYIDIDIDNIMGRTKNRASANGRFSEQTVLMIGLSLIIIGVFILLLTSISAALLGLFGSFAYLVLYTLWTKRRYTINTVVGSISGAVPPLIGWAAIDSNLHMYAIVLFFMVFIWQPPHFFALAMRRVEEYRAAGIPMLPVVYGSEVTKRQIMTWILCLLPLPFYLYSLGTLFIVGVSVLTIGWFIVGLKGYKTQEENKWATKMFIYSINYLTILCVMIVIATLF